MLGVSLAYIKLHMIASGSESSITLFMMNLLEIDGGGSSAHIRRAREYAKSVFVYIS